MYISDAKSTSDWIYDNIENEQLGEKGSFREYIHTKIYSKQNIDHEKLEKAKRIYKKILKCHDDFQNNTPDSEEELLKIKNKIVKFKLKIEEILSINCQEDLPAYSQKDLPAYSQEDLIILEIQKGDPQKVLELLQKIDTTHLKNPNMILNAVKYGMTDVAKLLMKHNNLEINDIANLILFSFENKNEEFIIFLIKQFNLPPSLLGPFLVPLAKLIFLLIILLNSLK